MSGRIRLFALALLLAADPASRAATLEVQESADEVRISTPQLEAAVRKRGYVSGVAQGTFLDRQTGFRDPGYGLDIVDWLLQPGSDAAYRDRLPAGLAYDFDNPVHGRIAKRSVEGPQICTQAKALAPEILRGRDFVAVKQRWRYPLAAPGYQPGSTWEQTLVFPAGKRWFVASDRIVSANAVDALFLRLDMPGHIRHTRGDTFSEIYLSYYGRIPASEFLEDFAPDARFLYRRAEGRVPRRFIRACRLRDPNTGRDGPWLAGMTLRPDGVHEAWCHQRGYVCFIEEIGGRPVQAGDAFGAAYIVGYFDSVAEMEKTYDRYAGHDALAVTERHWKLVRR